MLTFSAICDEFVKAEGFEKDLCTTDAEAVQKAAALNLEPTPSREESQACLSCPEARRRKNEGQHLNPLNPAKYPVRYFASDTTGEKAYEEFYIPGERINMNRFLALGVVEETTRRPMPEVNAFFEKLEDIFTHDDFTKAQVVDAIREFIPNFQHEEKGKNLDSKM